MTPRLSERAMKKNKIALFLSVFAVLFVFGLVALIVTVAAHFVVHNLTLAESVPLFLILPMFGMAVPFQELPCSVAVSNTYDTHGTITRASMNNLTPTTLAALFSTGGLFNEMDDWFRTSFEMKACGTKVNCMYDWLMSSARTDLKGLLDTVKLDRGPSLLKPFIMARQDSVINNDYWVVVNGVAVSGYTGDATGTAVGTISTGPLTAAQKALGAASDRIVRVITRYGIDLDPKWFITRDRIQLFNKTGGTSLRGQWKVLASAVDDTLAYVDVLLTSENAGSTTPWHQTPTAGVIIAGTNNVNDFESFCQNRPALNPRKHVPFWYKTDRRSRRVDSETKKVFARLAEGNKYFETFQNLPLSEYNRQDEETYQKRWVNDFFYSKKISANQTMALWQSLEQITTVTGATVDPGLGGKLIAYRANPVGVMEQLRACGRVIDLQNNPLNFYEWLDENYRIMRARKSQGRTVDTLDWFTDQRTAANIETGFITYLRQEYGDIVRIQIETGTNELGFSWKIFSNLKYPVGLKIALVTADFFDDMVNAFDNESIGSAGRHLWCLDIGKPGPKGGTIYPGMIQSNSKTTTLGDLQTLSRIDTTFACVMEHITEEIRMTSSTWTAVLECPANSIALDGLADAAPVMTGRSGSTVLQYSDLY